jgi:hypothetical protein
VAVAVAVAVACAKVSVVESPKTVNASAKVFVNVFMLFRLVYLVQFCLQASTTCKNLNGYYILAKTQAD